MKKENCIVTKKYVIYVRESSVQMMIIKNIIKSEIIVITLENIEELLMMFVI